MGNKTLNSNISQNGKVYHIQTEIIGDRVVTQIFLSGRVIFSFKDNFVDYATTNKQHKTAEAAVIKNKIKLDD
ncbi:MAG: hypothetical protein LDL13_04505 [Calditerrivibrio sp.]|nr:hypothetical protein [Calditerrivibrio sp.]MCA1980526.1 hypothetical protein [Calditerrivibrio sp.]